MHQYSKSAPLAAVTGSLNKAFGAALLEPDAPIPEGVIGPRGKKAVKRFAVYRNNVIVSLMNAMADIFPVVKALLGEKSFNDVARIFITRHPPTSPLLFEYGRQFPDFLSRFKPLSAYPFLPDLALLERAWLDGFHAADAVPMDPAVFTATDQALLGDLVFLPHPATKLVESEFAIVTLMNHCRENLPLDTVDPRASESALVTRPENRVEVRAIAAAGTAFFRLLIDGNTLGFAADAAMATDPEFDLPAAITALIQSGAFTAAAISPANNRQGETE